MKPHICLYGFCYVAQIQSYLGTKENSFETEKYILHFSIIASQYSFLHSHFRKQISILCKTYPYVLNFTSIPKVHKNDQSYLTQGLWLPDRGEWTLKQSKEYYSGQDTFTLQITEPIEKLYYEQIPLFLNEFSNLTLCFIARFILDNRKGYYRSRYSNYRTLYNTFKSRSLDIESLDKELNFSTMIGNDGMHIKQIDGKPDASKLLAIVDYYFDNYVLLQGI